MRVRLFHIAVKSLRDRSVRSWITILGIVISIAVILILFTLSAGLSDAVKNIFEDLGTNRVFVLGATGAPTGLDQGGLTTKDVENIEKLPQFRMVVPRLVQSGIKVTYHGREQFLMIGSLPNKDVDNLVQEYKLDRDLVEGRFFEEGERNVAIVGYAVANKPDDFFGRPLSLKNKIDIGGKGFEIIGVYKKTGFSEDNIIIIPLVDAREVFNKSTQVSAIDAIVQPTVSTKEAAERLTRMLQRTKGEDNFVILTPDSIIRSFTMVVTIIQGVLVAIASISLVVGAIGIANTMFTAVLEREREIGIMKAVGARNRDILSLFLIESGLIGLVGGTVGVILGVLISYAIGYIAAAAGFSLLAISVNVWYIVFCLSFSIIVGMLSGLLPSYLGSRKKIIDILREI